MSFRTVSQLLECCAVRTKGYDFFKAGAYFNSSLYASIAGYFGDIDENGVPLYKNDPYMPDYYDCEDCIEKRSRKEEEEKAKNMADYENASEDNGYICSVEYIPAPDSQVSFTMLNGRELFGYECRDLVTYTMRYNTRREDGKHGNHVKLFIKHTEGIELVSPDILTLDIPDGTTEFEISFKYTGKTATACFTIYSIDDLFENIDDYNNIAALESIENFDETVETSYYTALRFKDHDFFSPTAFNSMLYYNLAVYYGDVDENGIPLFYNDPYMLEYYDNPWCETARMIED